MKIKTDDYWKPQLRALLFFVLPHQTSFLLYKCRFDEVNLTRRCFQDVKSAIWTKIHMVGRGLLQEHFCKSFVKIFAVTQK